MDWFGFGPKLQGIVSDVTKWADGDVLFIYMLLAGGIGNYGFFMPRRFIAKFTGALLADIDADSITHIVP